MPAKAATLAAKKRQCVGNSPSSAANAKAARNTSAMETPPPRGVARSCKRRPPGKSTMLRYRAKAIQANVSAAESSVASASRTAYDRPGINRRRRSARA